MSEKEFEERQLTKLISDLRDINSYTDFKNGAFIYDLGHYQGLLLVNEIERLNNIIKEAREYIKEKYDYLLKDETFLDHDERIDSKQIKHILEILDKMIPKGKIINEVRRSGNTFIDDKK